MAIPEAVEPLIDGLISLARRELGQRLESCYLIGSLAHGGFSPRLGDVDACLVLAAPLEDGDGPRLVELGGELAERFPRFGPRLSLFWATEAILRGQAQGGRLGRLDAVDLAQNGLLVWGREARGDGPQPDRTELVRWLHADLCERWKSHVAPFAGRRALESDRGADLDERTLIKAILYPARFLHAADTGRVSGHDQAIEHAARRFAGPQAAALRLALAVRNRPGPEATVEERRQLAAAYRPLYDDFFQELAGRYGLEAPRG